MCIARGCFIHCNQIRDAQPKSQAFTIRLRQVPSLEVYFWYHHQNLYKTFSDNNILKEEPCFCAWTRSPQKNALVLNTVKRTRKEKKKEEPKLVKIKINNKPTTKENNTAHIYTPAENQCSLQEMDEGGGETARRGAGMGAGGSPGWCGKRSGCGKLAWACTETKANSGTFFFLTFLLVTANSSQKTNQTKCRGRMQGSLCFGFFDFFFFFLVK